MLHPQTMQQFAALKRRYPSAELRELASGSALVSLPEFAIPSGWNAAHTRVRFLVPIGYPGPAPDCFWASTGLRLANQQMPHASQEHPQIPETHESGLWFSWHVTDRETKWNPSRDTLETYVAVIAERFRRTQ